MDEWQVVLLNVVGWGTALVVGWEGALVWSCLA
jgi:hypothetical protein